MSAYGRLLCFNRRGGRRGEKLGCTNTRSCREMKCYKRQKRLKYSNKYKILDLHNVYNILDNLLKDLQLVPLETSKNRFKEKKEGGKKHHRSRMDGLYNGDKTRDEGMRTERRGNH